MRHDERGSALLVAMLIMLAMAILGATFLSVSLTDRKIASNEADANKAFAVSEAGIEDARAALASTTVNTLLAAGGHLFTGSSVGGGTYVVDVKNNCCGNLPASTIVPVDAGGASVDTDRYLVLNATGTLKKASRRIQTVVLMPISFFSYGVWCNAGADMSGASMVDAYDSTLGPYGGANIASDAGVFCNGNFNMSGSASVHGNCTVADTSCTGGGGVTGTRTTGAATMTFAPVACPASYPATVTGTGVTYNAVTGALTVSGGSGNVTLPVPPTSYYFSSVTLSGGSTLTLAPAAGQHVDIYVSGMMDTSGGGVFNTSSDPTRLSLWACGAGTTQWKLSGGSGAYFAVYAPTRDITISGGSSIFGSVVGDQITNSGGSQIHYDHALAGGTIPSVVPRTWREIFP